ncbi:hypothetical protein [uncultured Mailhella sp.]|uniref:hypothetical protein n=1 Tax=uncultured Mailhella sp. TaxID=1981031 RepID=UPI00262E73C5|nr:hypothetical protein [uncultured Mailhella sp.]
MPRTTTEHFSLPVGMLLTVICCFLLMTPASQVTKKTVMDASVHITTMTLAVTGISNPLSPLSHILGGERTPFRTDKRSHTAAPETGNGGSPHALPASCPDLFLPLPCAVFPHTGVLYFTVLANYVPWFALAPPRKTADPTTSRRPLY